MKKKICFITSAQKIGGTELSTMRLSRIFVQAGHDVTMIAPRTVMKDELDRYKIPFVPVNISGRTPFGVYLGALRLSKILKTEKFDVIHCQDVFPVLISYYARKLSKLSLPIIWHERGIHEYTYWLMTKFSYMPDLVIANSYNERNKLIAFGFDPNKIKVIYNAIEAAEITKSSSEIRTECGIAKDAFLIGSIGRLNKDKGVFHLLQAFNDFQHLRENVYLLIVGDGDERKSLEEYVTAHNLSEKVVFAGFRRDTANLYNAMDVFAFPSLYEAFGNVAVEAMLARTPVLASYVGGIPEIITNNQTGKLAPVAEKDKWVEALIYLYDQPKLRLDMADRAFEMAAERFCSDRLHEELDNVYNGMVKN